MRSFILKWSLAPWTAEKVSYIKYKRIIFPMLQLNKHLSLCACVSTEEFVAFFDRLVFVRRCEQVAGSELNTRTNVLLVRQSVLTPGNGVVFTYTSQKNMKKSHHQGKSAGAELGWWVGLLLLFFIKKGWHILQYISKYWILFWTDASISELRPMFEPVAT